MKTFSIAKSRRIRSTPYTSRIEKQGVTAYTTYNHMLLPAAFGSLEDSYHHLKKSVQVWDVAGERQVEISGKDSAKLVQLMTCRDLSKSKEGRCYYCPIIDDKGGIINDPVVLKLGEERWWLSIADSDVLLYAKGLAIGKKFEVKIFEPDVNIIAVQGPKSFKLMEKVFGQKITELKFFGFDFYDFKGTKHLIQCHCLLPQYRNKPDPVFHKFPVFSVIDESDTVILKYAECNNCGAAHKVYDICKSEILTGRDEARGCLS